MPATASWPTVEARALVALHISICLLCECIYFFVIVIVFSLLLFYIHVLKVKIYNLGVPIMVQQK